MLIPTERRIWHFLCVVGISMLAFFWNLGGAALWDVDEGRNATCALEMSESDNWIVPSFNANLRVDKPVLLYWLQMLAYRCFGISEFSARLPSALAAMGSVWLCYELGRSMFGASTGFLAAFIIATSPMSMGSGRFANPDALLHFFAVLTLFLFFKGQNSLSRLWFVAMGAAAGLGVLAKGPVAIALPGAVVMGYLLLQRNLLLALDRRIFWAASSCFWIAAPWYIWVAVETRGQFIYGFFFTHNVNRFVAPMEAHSGSPLYYPAVLVIGLAPWTIFFLPVLWYSLLSMLQNPRGRLRAHWLAASETAAHVDSQRAQQIQAVYQFLGVWIGVYVVFFTLAATKLPNYVLPVVIPCALLTARFLERWRVGELPVPAWAMVVSMGGLALVGISWILAMVVGSGAVPLSVFRGVTFPAFFNWLWLGFVPVGGALAGSWFLWKNQRTMMLRTIALTALLFLTPIAAWFSAALNAYKVPQSLTDLAAAVRPNEDLRIGGFQIEHLPSLNFYVRQDVLHHSTKEHARDFLLYPMRVFLFMPATEWDGWTSQERPAARELGRQFDMFRSREYVVVTNR